MTPVRSVLLVEDLPESRDWLSAVAGVAFPQAQLTCAARCDEAARLIAASGGYDVALVDLGLPDGNGVDVVRTLRRAQPAAIPVVVTIHDDDEHLFPALRAGAFGYLLKEQPRDALVTQLLRILAGEPPLSPAIARRVLGVFASTPATAEGGAVRRSDGGWGGTSRQPALTEREAHVLQRVAKGFTLPEIAQQLGLSRHTVSDYVKQVYRKLDVSSRAEATLEAVRRGLVRP
ncbi:MAG: response regulator transcription factor [Burkholderiales bacterium]|nr:response regulator transcription factor [Burkholderiales bacterium]